MNLLRDKVFPAVGRDGTMRSVRLSELLTDEFSVFLPDAVMEESFLVMAVSIIQCVIAPSDQDDWLELFSKPMSAEELQGYLERIADAFEADDFLQVASMRQSEKLEEFRNGLSDLELSGPGSRGRAMNAIIVERKGMPRQKVSPAVGAIKLFTYLSNVGAAGRGDKSTIRGAGGPATFLVKHEKSLWKTVMLNILTMEELLGLGWSGLPTAEDMPWRAVRRLEEVAPKSTKDKVTPALLHPCSALFPIPIGLELVIEPSEGEVCSVTGAVGDWLVTGFRKRSNGGVGYGQGWNHPFSAMSVSSGARYFLKTEAFTTVGEVFPWNGFGMNWWAMGSKGSGDKAVTVHPPAVMSALSSRRHELEQADRSCIYITLSGPVLANAKMVSMTVYHSRVLDCPKSLTSVVHREFLRYSEGTRMAYSALVDALGGCLKRGDGKPYEVARSILSVYVEQINRVMMEKIHETIDVMRNCDKNDMEAGILSLRHDYHKYLSEMCMNLFLKHSAPVLFSSSGAIVSAHRVTLERLLYSDRKLPMILALPARKRSSVRKAHTGSDD